MLHYLLGFCILFSLNYFSFFLFFSFVFPGAVTVRVGLVWLQILAGKVLCKTFSTIFFLSGYPFLQRALLEILLKCISHVKSIRFRQGWASVQNDLSLREQNGKEHYAALEKKYLFLLRAETAPEVPG